MKQNIRAFMESQFLVEFGSDLSDDTDLFKAGVIDSFGYVQLVEFLQAEFGVTFSDEEILTNIMTTVNAMANAVKAKRSTAVPA